MLRLFYWGKIDFKKHLRGCNEIFVKCLHWPRHSLSCALVKTHTSKWVQSLSKFANKNIVAYFINIINTNIINITIDQLDMKLRLRENSINTS